MVTTVATPTVAFATLASSLTQISLLVLVALLIYKQLFLAYSEKRFRELGIRLNVAIAPLLIAFFIVVVARVAELLR